MSGRTPGPWLRSQCVGPLRDEITEASGNRLVCTVFVREHVNTNDVRGASVVPWPEGEANARLICAAPDLLALAERYADECSCCDGTGTVWTNPNDPQEAIDLPCPDCADIRAVIDRAT